MNCSRGKTKDRSENSSGRVKEEIKRDMQKEENWRHIDRVFREKDRGN
jgi:hypothetical protein